MIKNNYLDIIILLNGNFIPITILRNNKDVFIKQLIESVQKFDYVNMDNISFKSSSFVGYYIKESSEKPIDKIIEFMDKKIPDENSGNEWKND